jgi:hypothetical protein
MKKLALEHICIRRVLRGGIRRKEEKKKKQSGPWIVVKRYVTCIDHWWKTRY